MGIGLFRIIFCTTRHSGMCSWCRGKPLGMISGSLQTTGRRRIMCRGSPVKSFFIDLYASTHFNNPCGEAHMQKPLAIISLFIIALCISCTGSPSDSEPAEPIAVDVSTAISGSSGSTQVSKPIPTSGGAQEISLKGLEPGKLYTVYTSSGTTRASRRAAESASLSVCNTIKIPRKIFRISRER